MAAPFRTERRVEFRDTDAAGLVHFTAFFHWMESAEHALWREIGVELVANEPGSGIVSWPRVSAACDYERAVRFGDVVGIEVRVAKVGRSSVSFAFAFFHDEAAIASGTIVAVRCRLQPGRPPEPLPIPEDVAAKLDGYTC
jgi:acyl-CoA thioester hydrolase